MSRRDHQLVISGNERSFPAPPPSKCAKFLYYTWKLCSVVFSHLVMISLVVAYCILGAVTFEKLESEHEKEVKKNISHVRDNTTQCIWTMTRSAPLLNQSNWTSEVVYMLKDFENSILYEIKMRGWDGSEELEHTQWTFVGALFYSIIVITTIGYGHIAPKTQTGKIVTIFYAILGIPLMLLCLSNIGDVMASSFRFLYWRACCYMCTRPPPKRRRRHHSSRRSVRGRTSSVRRKPKALQRAHSDTDFRYRDSGYSSGRARRRGGPGIGPAGGPGGGPRAPRTRSQPPQPSTSSYLNIQGRNYDYKDKSPTRYERYDVNHELDDNDDFPKISLPLQDLAAALKDLEEHHHKQSKPDLRSKSLPRQNKAIDLDRFYDDELVPDSIEMHDLRDVDYENFKQRKAIEGRDWRKKCSNEYESYRDGGYDPEDDDFEFEGPRYSRTLDDRRRNRGCSEYYDRGYGIGISPRNRRARSAYADWERRYDDREWDKDGRWHDIETGRNRRLRRLHTTDETLKPERQPGYSPSPCPDDWSDEEPPPRHRTLPPNWNSRQLDAHPYQDPLHKEDIKPVPIWLCVLLVASYIVAGTFLFKSWEGWSYLDAAYFCFITLTTIGFGDFVPAQSKLGLSLTTSSVDAAAAVHSIALCALYLLFGIALLAMSFNLVQEEVRANVAAVATRLGIIKPQHDPQYESDVPTDEY